MQRLMHTETGKFIDPGTTIHLTPEASTAQAWRFEKVIPHPDGHKIQCTRSHSKMGRIHREFSPHLFGCQVVIDVKFYADRTRMMQSLRRLTTSGASALSAAVVAWLVAGYGNTNLQSVLALFGAH
jgi:hypothetical protein